MIEIQDEKGYIGIVEAYSDMLYRIALQNLRTVQDAEDVVQEVFLKLLKLKKRSFEDQEHLKAWMIRVTLNQCTDLKRSILRRKERDIKEELYLYDEKKDSLLEEIMELPTEERNIIYLYYYEGYSIREIAEIMQKKQNTVNSKLTRARKKIKQMLEEDKHECIRRVNG